MFNLKGYKVMLKPDQFSVLKIVRPLYQIKTHILEKVIKNEVKCNLS